MKFACLLALLLLAAPLVAESADARNARRILKKPEYSGYRVETAPPEDVDVSQGERPKARENEAPRRGASGRVERTPTPQQSGYEGGSRGSMGSLDPTIFSVIFWVLVAIVVLFALGFIVRAILDRKPRRKKAVATRAEQVLPQEQEIVHAAVAFPQLEAQLEAALKAGDFAQATLLSYKLFWLKAGWRDVTSEQETKTWRDALKLVKQEELRREVRRLLLLVESVRYGRHKPDQSEFSSWREKLQGIDSKTVLA